MVDVQEEDGRPKSVTVEISSGERLRLVLGDTIDLVEWDLAHLRGHRRTSTAISVTYEERPGELVAVALEE